MESGGPGFYVYVLRSDTGFAPNPFHGCCTLACCKPAIRRKARVGDWILGITPKHLGNALAYAMRVGEVLTFAEYFRDGRFVAKRPVTDGTAPLVRRCGDNCYEPLPDGGYRQLPSFHSDGEREDADNKAWDLGGNVVLVSRKYAYFGSEPRELDERYSFMIPARYNRVKFTPDQRRSLETLVARLPRGVHAKPRHWRNDDESWRRRPRCR